MDSHSIEILTRWKREHEVKATLEEIRATSLYASPREIKDRREQAQFHREQAAAIAERLSRIG